MLTTSRFQLGHRKCLDGVRGLAVLVVLIFHLPTVPITGGFLGVDLFFVLSGFLITSLLMEEWQTSSTISLGRFYLRRALRLLPALLLVIGACLFASRFIESQYEQAQTRRMAVYAIGYIANYAQYFGLPNNPFLGHTWSLSIEEHYYLIWPLALLLMLRAQWRRSTIVGVMVLLILISLGFRAYYWIQDQRELRAYFFTLARLDGVLIGSLAALTLAWGYAPRSPRAVMLLKLGALVSLVSFCSFAVNGTLGPIYFLGGVVLNLGMAVLICSLMLAPIKPIAAIFENKALMYLGKISYGLYLWHPCVYALVRNFDSGRQEYRWLICLPLTLAVSVLSFLFVERPLQKLRVRLRPSAAIASELR
jgi:peptidoglycan/LPS O-acetylase OafA/YrhL